MGRRAANRLTAIVTPRGSAPSAAPPPIGGLFMMTKPERSRCSTVRVVTARRWLLLIYRWSLLMCEAPSNDSQQLRAWPLAWGRTVAGRSGRSETSLPKPYDGRSRLLSTVARVQNNVRLLWPAGRGLALLAVNWATATPRRICVGAALSALLIGLGANAILKRVERYPPPPSAEANQQAAPAAAKVPTAAARPASAALVIGKEEAPIPALTAAPAAANASRPNSTEAAPAGLAVQAPAAKAAVPDALAEKHAARSKFARTPSPIQTRAGDSGELQSAARARDPIGDLLRGKHSGGLPTPRQD
jgi:hypothetical protein